MAKNCYARFSAKRFEMLVRKGWTDQECADFFDISISSITIWKNRHPEFLTALKNWKQSADYLVEKSLYERAIGFRYDEITYEKSKVGGLGIMMDDGEIEGMKHTETMKTKIVTKMVPPDTTAQIFWLKNRQPDRWREKESVEKQVETRIIVIRDEKKPIVVETQKDNRLNGREISFNT